MFIVHYDDGKPLGARGRTSGYVRKHDGMNSFLDDPDQASKYPTEEEARDRGKVGHHRDMGGSGFRGRVVSLRAARLEFQARESRRRRW